MELLEKQGIDLKEEMQKRLVALEEQYQREKEEVQKEFDKERKVRRGTEEQEYRREGRG